MIEEEFIMIVVLLLHFMDIMFTQYHFFLMRKKGIMNTKFERSWLPRKLMGKNPIRPIVALRSFLVTGTIVYFMVMYSFLHNATPSVFFVMGVFAMMDYIHIFQIKDLKKHWNDEIFWGLRRHMWGNKDGIKS
jgi:hypothetical protein